MVLLQAQVYNVDKATYDGLVSRQVLARGYSLFDDHPRGLQCPSVLPCLSRLRSCDHPSHGRKESVLPCWGGWGLEVGVEVYMLWLCNRCEIIRHILHIVRN